MKFEDLLVWKRSAKLCVEVYQQFDKSRDFGFKDQITRSALSIVSNIAEGYERDSDRDRVKFLSYAKGSCAELRAQIYIGIQIGYIDRTLGQQWAEETRDISRMLYGLMAKMRC
ncbi:four helix bundle protein [Halomonas sp. SL1]|uniref:four helix bundle protein n=1 Tax=Halomonas sp. SL1 TaxID=2137478 RepID=UPI000D16AF1E|nr:four helix bundle protein [Halomonas sp. SL1]RAH38209.1 four helix bundle protein [Halomonas sp. SL1]